MAPVHIRVVGGVVAWGTGAVMATALSMFAVSALGEGLSDGRVRTLTSGDVAHALSAASATGDPAGGAAGTGTPSGGASPTAVPPGGTPAAPRTSAPAAPTASASPTAPAGDTDRSGAVGSPGGTATAVCGDSGVYLSSWSPAQGYLVREVSRGPARVATVVFVSARTVVVLRVTCASGVPGAQVTTRADDDAAHQGESDDH